MTTAETDSLLRAAWARIQPRDSALSFDEAMAKPPLAALIRWAAVHPEALHADRRHGPRACGTFSTRRALFTRLRAVQPKQLKLL